MALAAVDDPQAPPEGGTEAAHEDGGEAAEEQPQGRQLRIDGMPVTANTLGFSGTLTVPSAFVKPLKLGTRLELRVFAVVSSKKGKTKTSGGESTGEAEQHLILQVYDVSRLTPEQIAALGEGGEV